MRRYLSILIVFGLMLVQAQDTYLSQHGSQPEVTQGVSRLLHYLPQDMPIEVYLPVPDVNNGLQLKQEVENAFRAWQTSVPELISFQFVSEPSEDSVNLSWLELDAGRIGSYRYRYSILPDGQFRFQATDVFLDPRHQAATLYRFALVQVGHVLGLLGRSPFRGDALSMEPSGIISERDKATLRSLYAVPSGIVLAD